MIGLVAPLGVDLQRIESIIDDFLRQFKYRKNSIVLSSLIRTVDGLGTELSEEPEDKRIDSYMTAGNEAREKAGRGDFLAALAICNILSQRKNDEPILCTVHLFRSLKHPAEVQLLRDVYGEGFYLLGINSSRERRLDYLKNQKGIPDAEANRLIDRDESESDKLGQHMKDAFHLADGFIDMDSGNVSDQISRILDLIFGKPCVTPTRDEYAMFLAFAASIRSADLSRQVGAVITSKTGEIIATGANDVPCFGGGLYWADHADEDQRDYQKGFDSNEDRRNKIVTEIMKKFNGDLTPSELLKKGKEALKDTGILDITEYGRAVHAEMEALLSCGRSGVSTRESTLYTTTFPCHNCAKHIVASGISRVVFVEPYPKSLAMDLHSDAIFLAHEGGSAQQSDKVCFEPFIGIGPRRFLDLFSMDLSRGRKTKREEDGKFIGWGRDTACVRVPLSPISYIDRETYVSGEIDNLMGGNDDHQKKDQ
ncbi:MAG: cytidine deaminase [Deltaproteobacteria bacterium]|nr:cytidine deaminase [Deltaproteobacteria bacterium]